MNAWSSLLLLVFAFLGLRSEEARRTHLIGVGLVATVLFVVGLSYRVI